MCPCINTTTAEFFALHHSISKNSNDHFQELKVWLQAPDKPQEVRSSKEFQHELSEKLSRQSLINLGLKEENINFVCFNCQSVVYMENRREEGQRDRKTETE